MSLKTSLLPLKAHDLLTKVSISIVFSSFTLKSNVFAFIFRFYAFVFTLSRYFPIVFRSSAKPQTLIKTASTSIPSHRVHNYFKQFRFHTNAAIPRCGFSGLSSSRFHMNKL